MFYIFCVMAPFLGVGAANTFCVLAPSAGAGVQEHLLSRNYGTKSAQARGFAPRSFAKQRKTFFGANTQNQFHLIISCQDM